MAGESEVQKGFLVCDAGGKEERRIPVGASMVVGRTGDCGLIIDDAAASRRHLEIIARNEGFFWKDLGSTNGTLLNGARMLEGRLRNGDHIQIGETVMQFVVEEMAEQSVSAEDSTIFKETIIDRKGMVRAADVSPGKSDELLRAVYTIMNEIATNYEPCSLVDRILETTIKAVDAQRGAVLFSSSPTEKLMPCPVCGHVHMIENGKLRKADTGEIRLSHTVANRVLSGGESVLFLDTDQDRELNAAESIMSLRLRSIICVPLRGKQGITGVLYMDSDRPEKQYTHDDMLLSTAVGNSAGLALENARMHIQILEKQRTDQEIEHAWTIQESFLVKEWPREDLRFVVYGETHPAKIIGGDFYDFVRPSKDVVGILIGDVSGKGVPAALSMAQLLAEFRLHAMTSQSPVEVLESLNRSFVSRSQRGMFCTLCYSTLDLVSGQLITANAGHHPILRIGKKGPQYLSAASGPPAGIFEGPYWTMAEEIVEPGDSLLMYTDGIVEAHGPSTLSSLLQGPDEFGPERLLEIVRDQYGQPPEALIKTVHRHVRQFCAPSHPHDDCTMIAWRFVP